MRNRHLVGQDDLGVPDPADRSPARGPVGRGGGGLGLGLGLGGGRGGGGGGGGSRAPLPDEQVRRRIRAGQGPGLGGRVNGEGAGVDLDAVLPGLGRGLAGPADVDRHGADAAVAGIGGGERPG